MYGWTSLIIAQKHNFLTLFSDFGQTGSDYIHNIFAAFSCSASTLCDLQFPGGQVALD